MKKVKKEKDRVKKSFNISGLNELNQYDIRNFIDIVDGKEDMAYLHDIMKLTVQDPNALLGDSRLKRQLLNNCAQTCYITKNSDFANKICPRFL